MEAGSTGLSTWRSRGGDGGRGGDGAGGALRPQQKESVRFWLLGRTTTAGNAPGCNGSPSATGPPPPHECLLPGAMDEARGRDEDARGGEAKAGRGA